MRFDNGEIKEVIEFIEDEVQGSVVHERIVIKNVAHESHKAHVTQ